MLTHRPIATSPVRTFLRGVVHAGTRRSVTSLVSPSPCLPGAPPVSSSSLSSSSSSSSSSLYVTRVRTRLRIISQDGSMCRINGVVGAWTFIRVTPAAATNSCRCFSSTAGKYLAAERKDGREPTKAQEDAPQSQLKGIRKVLPSLTTHENIYTVPNLLTFSRLVVAPFIGYAILHDAHTLALGLFAYAGVSDLLDGWIARRWKLQTVVGSVVDPMADKLLMTVLTICLAMQGSLPVWLATIILGRDVGLGVSAIYYRWISLPPPKTFTRYWDFSLPSAEVRPTTISKYNTFLQLGLMGATMLAPVVAVDVGSAMTAFQYIVATTTVWSGLSYVFSKDAVRILSESKEQNKPKDS
ncbi:CDP-alcohol phosphatidyltransferase-domain-containing protein [Xylaria sp. FL1042]|nr:CDP-alcohol phosphatidyltransferase-domain-containing protein [Xylaria sp. FL1042]